MIHEQKNVPRLVDLSKYPSLSSSNFNSNFNFVKYPKPKIKWWSINKILLVGFLVFSIFFLWNCKYGIFKSQEELYAALPITNGASSIKDSKK